MKFMFGTNFIVPSTGLWLTLLEREVVHLSFRKICRLHMSHAHFQPQIYMLGTI